ncbi:EAL domain-containing protein [Leifsonia aquatica]|uniref:EAL domain-containing protein n=1 Tax=Leifsonia aquatica TaxID=144185 RepID=UPI0028A602F2|nr:EAL domain-containing protein [Leifsonia aquatica]
MSLIRESNSIERLAAELPVAVEDEEIVPFFQPQISVPTGRVVAAELLGRWRHPELGFVPPAVFIPIAESTRAIHQLGRQMLRAGCRAAASWQSKGNPLDVAVNVAPSQLATEEFYVSVREELDSSGIDPARLTLEVTEETVIADPALVAERLDRLRDIGVVVSIDDFGAGHSSQTRVIDLRASELKLDRRLVAPDDSERSIATVIDFAHERGIRTVGEGVETRVQLDRLRALGCDRAQGYLIAKPAGEEQFGEWLREYARA